MQQTILPDVDIRSRILGIKRQITYLQRAVRVRVRFEGLCPGIQVRDGLLGVLCV